MQNATKPAPIPFPADVNSVSYSNDDNILLTSNQARARVGGVSHMCIWRWMRDDRVQFPQPVQINRRNYWRLGDLRAWQAKQAGKTAS